MTAVRRKTPDEELVSSHLVNGSHFCSPHQNERRLVFGIGAWHCLRYGRQRMPLCVRDVCCGFPSTEFVYLLLKLFHSRSLLLYILVVSCCSWELLDRLPGSKLVDLAQNGFLLTHRQSRRATRGARGAACSP